MAQITTDDLRRMEGQEGLIFQNCCGPVQEWIDKINRVLTQKGILLNGTSFSDVLSFQHNGVTNLYFPFDDVDLDIGRLCFWRLETYDEYGGTWFTDYVPSQLGGFQKSQETEKPDCCLIGENGNIFNLMALAARTLRENGLSEQAEEMRERITGGECHDYSAALNVIGEYVNITGPEKPSEQRGGMELG